MEITPLSIPDVKLLTPKRHGDHRGFFSEVYNAAALRAHGIDTSFIDNAGRRVIIGRQADKLLALFLRGP